MTRNAAAFISAMRRLGQAIQEKERARLRIYIGAAPGVDLSLKRMLIEGGIDPDEDEVKVGLSYHF